MIRIRGTDIPAAVVDLAAETDGIEIVANSAVIALEEEKNNYRSVEAVNGPLRDHFEDVWKNGPALFSLVSVETRAGCNHECSFCPVSRSIDPRPPGEMSTSLLEKIASELAALEFCGRVALFGNNEPLLDRRLSEIVKLFRLRLPDADLRILSNGTTATVDDVYALFDAGLSTLIINNYTDRNQLIAPVRKLIEAAENFEGRDLRISLRERRAVLTTRAGRAPNKSQPEAKPTGFCALPFTDLHISYTGDVNLCCFDSYGETSMGNVAENSLLEIWNSDAYAPARRDLLRSRRAGLLLCSKCDFDGFREPRVGSDPPLLRGQMPDVQRKRHG